MQVLHWSCCVSFFPFGHLVGPFVIVAVVASVVGNTVSTSSLSHVIREMKYILKKQIELLKINTMMSELKKQYTGWYQ